PKPSRHPIPQRAASPRSRRKRQKRSKRHAQPLAGRAPSESNQIRSGAMRHPGHSVAPGSDRRLALIGRTPAADHDIRSVMGTAEVPLRPSDPARSYASTNCRSQQAAYPAVCGKRATLPGQWGSLRQKIAPRAELIERLDVKRPGIRAGGMIAIPLPNIGSMGGAYGHAPEALFPALSSIPVVLRFAALNPFYGADRSRMRCWEGIASRVPPQAQAAVDGLSATKRTRE